MTPQWKELLLRAAGSGDGTPPQTCRCLRAKTPNKRRLSLNRSPATRCFPSSDTIEITILIGWWKKIREPNQEGAYTSSFIFFGHLGNLAGVLVALVHAHTETTTLHTKHTGEKKPTPKYTRKGLRLLVQTVLQVFFNDRNSSEVFAFVKKIQPGLMWTSAKAK